MQGDKAIKGHRLAGRTSQSGRQTAGRQWRRALWTPWLMRQTPLGASGALQGVAALWSRTRREVELVEHLVCVLFSFFSPQLVIFTILGTIFYIYFSHMRFFSFKRKKMGKKEFLPSCNRQNYSLSVHN
jgi:hypothetical protein